MGRDSMASRATALAGVGSRQHNSFSATRAITTSTQINTSLLLLYLSLFLLVFLFLSSLRPITLRRSASAPCHPRHPPSALSVYILQRALHVSLNGPACVTARS